MDLTTTLEPARLPVASTTVVLADVHRRFGAKPALGGLSLDAPAGKITVLLGPNGAGKTTAIRVITGALTAESGVVRTFGLDPAHPDQGEEVRRRCGVVSAKPALYDRLSGRDNLRYAAALYGLDTDRAPIAESAARFGIDHALDRQVGGYSTGMKTRLALARSVLHRPDLLLLDEPTSGLDPESSVAVLGLIRESAASGTTVVLCTHLLLEAEGLADHVVVLGEGVAACAGPPDALIARHWPDAMVRVATVDGHGLATLAGRTGVLGVDAIDRTTVAVRVDRHERVSELVRGLVEVGAEVTRVEPFHPTLEDLYFAVRGVARGEMTTVEDR